MNNHATLRLLLIISILSFVACKKVDQSNNNWHKESFSVENAREAFESKYATGNIANLNARMAPDGLEPVPMWESAFFCPDNADLLIVPLAFPESTFLQLQGKGVRIAAEKACWLYVWHPDSEDYSFEKRIFFPDSNSKDIAFSGYKMAFSWDDVFIKGYGDRNGIKVVLYPQGVSVEGKKYLETECFYTDWYNCNSEGCTYHGTTNDGCIQIVEEDDTNGSGPGGGWTPPPSPSGGGGTGGGGTGGNVIPTFENDSAFVAANPFATDCATFNFTRTSSLWQEAGIKNVKISVWFFDLNGIKHTVDVTLNQVVIGLPARYSYGAAANMAAKAIDYARDNTFNHFRYQDYVNNGEVERYFRNEIDKILRQRGGTASVTGSGSSSIIYNDSQVASFFTNPYDC